ncbi:MAG: OsmC family protein [Candidatus Dormiibacterota bacterium]
MGSVAAVVEQLRVEYEQGDRFRIAIRQHTVRVDQPQNDGGEDTAPTPTELFIASLASCVAFYARRFLTRHGHSAEGLAVTSEVEYATHPYRVAGISLKVEVQEVLPPELQASLLTVASHCTVHNSLRQPPQVSISLAG